jgi:hypothetical protein
MWPYIKVAWKESSQRVSKGVRSGTTVLSDSKLLQPWWKNVKPVEQGTAIKDKVFYFDGIAKQTV